MDTKKLKIVRNIVIAALSVLVAAVFVAVVINSVNIQKEARASSDEESQTAELTEPSETAGTVPSAQTTEPTVETSFTPETEESEETEITTSSVESTSQTAAETETTETAYTEQTAEPTETSATEETTAVIETTETTDTEATEATGFVIAPTEGLVFTLMPDEKSYSVTSGTADNYGFIVIPPKYSGLPVTKIDTYAFTRFDKITQITIPDTVTVIGSQAFYQCDMLKTIVFTGTREQWESIQKGKDWDSLTSGMTVKCTDGDILIDEH